MKLLCPNCSREDVVPENFRHDLYCRYCGTKMRDRTPGHPALPKKIMIVDDEPDIVAVCKRILQDSGYSVVGFTDPVLALRDFDLNHSIYDLVICDNRMQRMTGLGFIMNIKRLRPDIKVILMSAYEMKREELDSFPITEFLAKPLAASTLSETVGRHSALS